jgi:glucosamine kinase
VTARYFLGIDGGGSGCRARIRDRDGRLLAEAAGLPANFYQSFEGGLRNVKAALEEASRRAGIRPRDLHAGLGLAGLVTSVPPEAITAESLGVASVTADVDAYAAFVGAFAGGDGGIVIAGTGSIGFGVAEGKRHMVGGWGLMIGDEGSGAWLGVEAVRRTAHSFDGFAEPTALTAHIRAKAGETMFTLSRWTESAKPGDYAAFAPAVFEFAAKGDEHAADILADGAAAISRLIRALLSKGIKQVCLLGGLAQAYPPHLDASLRPALVAPIGDALDGAIMMARRTAGLDLQTRHAGSPAFSSKVKRRS